jgi:hypothetical protein
MAKKIYVNPQDYQDSFTAGEESIKLGDDYLKSLEAQQAGLQGVAPKLQAAFEVGKQKLASQAAQALAQSKAVRGGKGLAVGTESAIRSGQAIGEMEKKSTLEQASALQEAARGQTALLAEKKKLAETKSALSAQVSIAEAEAQQIIDDESGVFVTTEEDIARMQARFKSEIAAKYANNPAALKAAMIRFQNTLGSGNTTEIIGGTYE